MDAPVAVRRGRRSTVSFDEAGAPVRIYHDTGHRVALARLPRGALAQQAYRGAEAALPAYLLRLQLVLGRAGVDTVGDAAAQLGVRPATAWSYACMLAERSCADASLRRLVWPPLADALAAIDSRGSLREVAQRLSDGPLRTEPEWRLLPDRLAQLRLCRLLSERARDQCARGGAVIFHPAPVVVPPPPPARRAP